MLAAPSSGGIDASGETGLGAAFAAGSPAREAAVGATAAISDNTTAARTEPLARSRVKVRAGIESEPLGFPPEEIMTKQQPYVQA
ncbi:hypothetical protein [Azospirillum sp. sgz301742]